MHNATCSKAIFLINHYQLLMQFSIWNRRRPIMRNVYILTILIFFSLVSLAAETLPALDRGVENARHPMLLIDERDNSIRYANPACAEYFSIPKERLIGRNFPALIGKSIHSLTDLHDQMISLETDDE